MIQHIRRYQLVYMWLALIACLLFLAGCAVAPRDDCMPFPDNHADHHRPNGGV